MNNRTEKIHAALDQLCDALNLGGSEFSAGRLFSILVMAFNANDTAEMEPNYMCLVAEKEIRQMNKLLSIDMLGLMARKIEEAWGAFETFDAERFKRN